MGFITKMLGVPQDIAAAIEEKKSIAKSLLQERQLNDDLRQRIEEMSHSVDRRNFRVRRDSQERVDDAEHKMVREIQNAQIERRTAIEDAINQTRRQSEKEIKGLNDTVAALRSQVRDLQLSMEEKAITVDLQIESGILDYRKEHLEDLTKQQVKVAQLEGEVKAAKAEAVALKELFKVAQSFIEGNESNRQELVKAIKEIAPKFDVSGMNFTVNAPQVKHEQKKN